jgi:hypothetical protein
MVVSWRCDLSESVRFLGSTKVVLNDFIWNLHQCVLLAGRTESLMTTFLFAVCGSRFEDRTHLIGGYG